MQVRNFTRLLSLGFLCFCIALHICDQICENLACRENVQVGQWACLVTQVENCQRSIFVIIMSKNLSTNYNHQLRRVDVSYQHKIRLYL